MWRFSRTPELAVRTRNHEDAVVLVVSGDLDVDAAPALAEHLERHVRGARDRLVVDLSGVTFMRSPAMTALLDAAQALRARGGRLSVVATADFLRTTFAVTGLEDELAVATSREEALARVREPVAARHR